MGRKGKDITGQRFGRLVAIKNTGEKKRNNFLWLCKCDCGNCKVVQSGPLQSGNIKSCGCLKRDFLQTLYKEGTTITQLNNGMRVDNTSGVKGVHWCKRRNRWISEISFQKKRKYLGSFENKQDAINARKEAEDKYFNPILEKYGKCPIS